MVRLFEITCPLLISHLHPWARLVSRKLRRARPPNLMPFQHQHNMAIINARRREGFLKGLVCFQVRVQCSQQVVLIYWGGSALAAETRSYRHTTTINMLPNNVFLDIFKFAISEWHTLVQVCQRWRYIVFASPRRLNLTILCTYGKPVRKGLLCWPPFPIVVDYLTSGYSPNYEGDIIASLEQPDRVRSVKLDVTGPFLGMVASVMQEPFMALTTLWLTSKDLSAPALPDGFLSSSTPQLQQIYLVGISFPALPTLLLSASDLVYLELDNIPQGGYISPEAMVTGLATLTRLESLRIWFQSPTVRLRLSYWTSSTRYVLPSLITFYFCGCSQYLEHFLA